MSYINGSRYSRTAKKKKSNRILNILIGIVFILIIFVAAQLFLGKNTAAPASSEEETPVLNEENKEDDNEKDVTEEEVAEEEVPSEEAPPTEETPVTEDEPEETTVEESGSSEEGVIRTLTGNWEPVGTVQSEPHVSIYDPNHVDWTEKLQAINRAVSVQSATEYTLWHLGNGGNEHSAFAKVTVKETNEHYRVYLEWETNRGWKPVMVEQTVDKDM